MNPSSRTCATLFPRNQTTVLIVTALAGFLATFMGSSIKVALAFIGSEFQASADLPDLHPSSGGRPHAGRRLADLDGRKRAFVCGMLTFALIGLLGLGLAFVASPITPSVMDSVDRLHCGVASAILGTMRLTGENISLGIATLALAIVVGRRIIESADYPNLLTSVRIWFAIFTSLCVVGVAVSLAGPQPQTPAVEGASP